MSAMIVASLTVNIVVLVPVAGSLSADAAWVIDAYGPRTQGRGILLSIYTAILLASVALLFIGDPRMVASLSAVQVVYKVTTPFTVGTLANPVVISNLIIAGLHVATLSFIGARYIG